MPYTEQVSRNKQDLLIAKLSNAIETKGDLNYTICELTAQLILKTGGMGYTNISEWIDAVHGAEREMTWRLLRPYEDVKIRQNGDVKSFEVLLKQLEGK